MRRIKQLVSVLLAGCCSMGLFSSAVQAETPSPFKATFLQGWLCRDWTQNRWNAEFQAMDEAGFEALILQTVCDLTYEQTDTAENPQNPDSYTLSSAYMLYPSAIPKLENAYVSSQNGGDALELALSAAKAHGMQVWIGTISDNRFWNYGWGTPAASESGDIYFSQWCKENGSLCEELITEIHERYAADYNDQIAGFYYVNEIWNMDAACAGTDDGVYAELIGSNINVSLEVIETLCPDKPLMISPFFNPDLSTAAQYGTFWEDIFTAADFRNVDIFAHQDGGGREFTPEVIREWAVSLKAACEAEGLQFWINHETFQTDGTAKPIAALAANREATADLTDSCVLFSWNHYYNSLDDPEKADLDATYLAYLSEFQPLQGDVDLDGDTDAADLQLLQDYLLRNAALTAPQAEAADLSADGVVDVFDLGILKKII